MSTSYLSIKCVFSADLHVFLNTTRKAEHLLSLTHCPLFMDLKLSWESRGVHWAVSCPAGSGSVAAAGLCLVLREAERNGSIGQHRGQSEGVPGEALHSDEQHKEQGSGPHRSTGGTRCCAHASVWDCTKCLLEKNSIYNPLLEHFSHVRTVKIICVFCCCSSTGSWSNVEQSVVKMTEVLGSVPNQSLRAKLEESLSLVKGWIFQPHLWLNIIVKLVAVNSPCADSSLSPQYSPDAVRAVWPPAPCLFSICPRFHHAGRDHESDGGDTATGGAVNDDQENAGKQRFASFISLCLQQGLFFCYFFWTAGLFVLCRESPLLFLSWRSGRPASPASLNHQRAQRSSSGLLSHSLR